MISTSPVYYRYTDTEIFRKEETPSNSTLYRITDRKQKAIYGSIPTMLLFRTNAIGDFRYYGKFGARTSFLLGNTINDKGFNLDGDTLGGAEVAQTNNSNYHANSGNSNHTNTTKPTKNPPSTKNPDDNPFANDGGSGPGKGGGKGGGLGKDDGDGKDDGPPGGGSGGGTRNRISEPNTREIHSDEDCNIKFKIRIDETGNIVGTPTVVRAGTTTTDEVLIKKVAALVKRDTRYSASKGAKIVEKTITVHVNAN